MTAYGRGSDAPRHEIRLVNRVIFECAPDFSPVFRFMALVIPQVRAAIDATIEPGGAGYVSLAGREGYSTLLNTDLRREGCPVIAVHQKPGARVRGSRSAASRSGAFAAHAVRRERDPAWMSSSRMAIPPGGF